MEAWWARLSWIEGMSQNIREALDEEYHQQVGHSLLKYRKVEPKQYLNHLAKKWCRLSTKIIRELKEGYFMPWCQTKHIIEFTKNLNKGQEELLKDGITISDESKIQHYMKQMYACGLFNMEQMIYYKDYSEVDSTVLETTKYFE